MQIIGITGTLGAGKNAVVEYLKKKGFAHFSARDFLLEEVRKRALPENRDSTNLVGEELRRNFGASYVLESLFKEAEKTGKNSVLESVRTVGEVNYLRTKPNFKLLAVDADPHVRYERVNKRKSSLDHVTFEKFMEDERRESLSKNPAEMNLPDCIRMADVLIMNNGSLAELNKQVEDFLESMPK